jgi:butyrate kinase
VLVVNPGSTSIKIAVYENDTCLYESEKSFKPDSITTPDERISLAKKLAELVKDAFEISGVESLDAISGRGGFLPRPKEKLAGGTYLVAENVEDKIVVDDTIVNAIVDNPEMEHASNLGIIVAANLAKHFNVPAFSVDPVVVDEFSELAEFSGYAPITRRSTSHALSIRATAKKAAEIAGRSVEDMNLVVAHLGGGITIASVVKGKMTDNSIALLGEGPFTPQRSGQLPANELIDLCYSGQFTKEQLKSELLTKAGLISYLDCDSMKVIEERIEQGDEKAKLAVDAMVYQIAKDIGAAFVAADCTAEAIVLTGGLTHSAYIVKSIRQRVGRLAPVIAYPGSMEMSALAAGAIAVMAGTQKALKYKSPTKR